MEYVWAESHRYCQEVLTEKNPKVLVGDEACTDRAGSWYGIDWYLLLKNQGFKSILARIQSRSPKEPYSTSPNQQTPSPSASTDSENTKVSIPQKISQPHYELVQTIEALQSWIHTAVKQGVVAVDTETTSLDQTRA